jgi:hypothetical protein
MLFGVGFASFVLELRVIDVLGEVFRGFETELLFGMGGFDMLWGALNGHFVLIDIALF